jgi:hypothetical protein
MRATTTARSATTTTARSTTTRSAAATTRSAPAAAARGTGNGRQRHHNHEGNCSGYRPYRHFLNPSILAVAER